MIPKRGFTLIELMVVMSIIGTMSSVLLTFISSARSSARDSNRISDLIQMRNALELFFVDHNRYPIADEIVCPNWRSQAGYSVTDCQSINGTGASDIRTAWTFEDHWVNYSLGELAVSVCLNPSSVYYDDPTCTSVGRTDFGKYMSELPTSFGPWSNPYERFIYLTDKYGKDYKLMIVDPENLGRAYSSTLFDPMRNGWVYPQYVEPSTWAQRKATYDAYNPDDPLTCGFEPRNFDNFYTTGGTPYNDYDIGFNPSSPAGDWAYTNPSWAHPGYSVYSQGARCW